jgi:hypothetical protein
MTSLTHISNSTWAGTLLALLTCLLLLSGCTTRPSAVVIPDSRELRQAWTCPSDGNGCVPDPQRVTVDIGYIRDIIRTFEECQK